MQLYFFLPTFNIQFVFSLALVNITDNMRKALNDANTGCKVL